jgi:hypothetical protein
MMVHVRQGVPPNRLSQRVMELRMAPPRQGERGSS